MKKGFFIILLLMHFVTGCGNFSPSKLNGKDIMKIAYSSGIPVFRVDSKQLLEDSDTAYFYFKANFIVMQKFTLNHYYNAAVNENSGMVNLVLKNARYNSSFFIYQQNSQYGLYTDSSGRGKKLLVDSFLERTMTHFALSNDYKKYWQLFFTSKSNNLLQEKYVSMEINPVNLKKDTMLLAFDDSYKDVSLDICAFLDSVYLSKLRDLRLVQSGYFDSLYDTYIPRQERYMKIEKKQIANEAEYALINTLIEKYKSQGMKDVAN